MNLNPFKSSKSRVGKPTPLDSIYRHVMKRTRHANPIMPNTADIVNWILYDRFIFGPTVTLPNQFNFFTIPVNTAGKTKIDTNIELVQQLPAPEWMNVTGLGFWVSGNTIKVDIDNFFNTSFMEFWVGGKCYLEGPLQCFPGQAGLAGVSTQTTESSYTIGVPVQGNIFDCRLPAGIGLGGSAVSDGLMGITILQGQQFQVKIFAPGGGATLAGPATVPTPGVGMWVMCFLYGVKSRGVY